MNVLLNLVTNLAKLLKGSILLFLCVLALSGALGSYYERKRDDNFLPQFWFYHSKKRKVLTNMETDKDVNFDWTGETTYPESVSILLDLILHLFVAFRTDNNIEGGIIQMSPTPHRWPHHIEFFTWLSLGYIFCTVSVFIHMTKVIVSVWNKYFIQND